MRSLAAAVAVVLLTTGCAVPWPKDDSLGNTKIAASEPEVDAIYDRYKIVRRNALRLLDEQPLTSVESGPVLAIDSGAIAVARRLLLTRKPDDSQVLQVRDVLTPRLAEYPLWFVAVVEDGVRKLTKLQIFHRESSVSTWEMVASPEMLPSVPLPPFLLDSSGALSRVDPGDDTGVAASPQEVMAAYADVLGDPGSLNGSLIEAADSFVTQMREVAEQSGAIKNTSFSQRWSARPVEYALRTADGGVLVFATLARTDRYRIKQGTAIDWPEGSEQKAFLSGQLYSQGVLDYFHQVLVYLPPLGEGKARVIGQYGGVVDGVGS